MPLSDVAAAALVDTFHTDTVSVYPASIANKGTLNADFTVSYSTPAARLSSVTAHIEPLISRPVRDDGGARIVDAEYSVKLTVETGDEIAPGDRVNVEASDDPALVDANLVVIRVEAGTARLSRRLICRRAQATQRPGD